VLPSVKPAPCLVTAPQREVADVVMATLWADCAERLDKRRLSERDDACSTSDVRPAYPCEGSLDRRCCEGVRGGDGGSRRARMSSSDVTSQIAFASVMLEATVARTVMAFVDCAEVEG
jgi:hypothetical protein